VSIFVQVLSVMVSLLALGALVYYVSKVHASSGKREGAQERMRLELVTATLVFITVAVQAITYSLQ
jgi:heme/copper-type cytochrome/quinol oxidase subunit 2